MVKFRCLCCSQKIAVNDEGIGVVIACPTCGERLIVPPRSDEEFPEMAVAGTVAELRRAVAPQLARCMMNRLFQTLWAQRQGLMQSQETAADQIEALEQRLALLQTQWQRRLAYYQERVAGLEAELAAQMARNEELEQRCRHLQAHTSSRAAGPRRVALQPSLLLRA